MGTTKNPTTINDGHKRKTSNYTFWIKFFFTFLREYIVIKSQEYTTDFKLSIDVYLYQKT